MNKKSQITIFILLGLFLLITAMLIIYFVYSQTKVELKEFPKDVLDNVQKLATSCLEQSANNAINLLAKQGGVIYTNQGGLTDANIARFVGEDKIAELVAIPQFSFQDRTITFSTAPPNYPWTTFPNAGNAKKYEANVLFGLNRLQPLEQDTDQISWKSQIIEKTQKELLNCINTQQLQVRGITVETQPKVTATITEKDVLMTSTEIVLKAQGGTTAKVQSIRARVPVKLKELHTKVMRVIDAEVFNMKNNPSRTPGVNTRKENSNTIVSISQDKTMLQFAIPNRRPALEYISDQEICEGSVIEINSQNNQIRINPPSQIPTGKTCNPEIIQLSAVDPDDDSLTFEVSSRENLPFTLTENTAIGVIVKDQSLEDSQTVNFKLK